jgi:hypothetical protein
MQIIKEVTIRQFNPDIEPGTPIQLRYTMEKDAPIVHAIVKENHGETLSYVCVRSGSIIEKKINVWQLRAHGIKLGVLESL